MQYAKQEYSINTLYNTLPQYILMYETHNDDDDDDARERVESYIVYFFIFYIRCATLSFYFSPITTEYSITQHTLLQAWLLTRFTSLYIQTHTQMRCTNEIR